MGTTGPASTGPDGRIYGLDLPVLTIRDMVRAQAALVTGLGIERLFAVIGGSMGGMQVLQWAASYTTAWSPRSASRPAPGTPRRTSPSTRWGGRR